MKMALKVLGWVVGILAALVIAVVVYPGLSETTKWAIAILVVSGTFAYQIDKLEQRQNEFRFRVTEDLYQIKRQLGID